MFDDIVALETLGIDKKDVLQMISTINVCFFVNLIFNSNFYFCDSCGRMKCSFKENV